MSKFKTTVALFALMASFVALHGAHALIDVPKTPMTAEGLVKILEANPGATTLDQVPALLPEEFLFNLILKHGIKRTGERGHLVETRVSQSADPEAPRVILYDERSGFSASYNGGTPGQTAGQRLDLLSFDHRAKEFSLEQIDFPIEPGKPKLTTSDCMTCHGPHERPIFSMYPDWPAFYGSDNDELTGPAAVQVAERADYAKFRASAAKTHARYRPLYDEARVRKFLGVGMYPSFPYRPDVSARGRDVSRAFAFRPELRMGILYNRLNAQNVFKRLAGHADYKEHAGYFLFNLLQCAWTPSNEGARKAWLAKAERALGEKPRTLSGGLLDYRQNWKLFGLTVNDVDIRYSYNHAGYANQDASRKVMEVGYIGRYFNSYFDGSATVDELVSAMVYADLAKTAPALAGAVKTWGLVDKYKHFTERFKHDEKFFRQMDAFGKWIHIPFPASLKDVHHRENFTADFANQHKSLCGKLEARLSR